MQDSITCYSDFIPVNDRFYVPHSIRPSYLQQCSQGHQGIFKCKNKARELFWWPGLSNENVTYVADCKICVKSGMVQHQPMKISEFPEGS